MIEWEEKENVESILLWLKIEEKEDERKFMERMLEKIVVDIIVEKIGKEMKKGRIEIRRRLIWILIGIRSDGWKKKM